MVKEKITQLSNLEMRLEFVKNEKLIEETKKEIKKIKQELGGENEK